MAEHLKDKIQQEAEKLIAFAERAGYDVTIGLVPLTPLAMGNHKMVAEVTLHKAY